MTDQRTNAFYRCIQEATSVQRQIANALEQNRGESQGGNGAIDERTIPATTLHEMNTRLTRICLECEQAIPRFDEGAYLDELVAEHERQQEDNVEDE